MKKEFEMSMLGELALFLGLQVSQSYKGIFITQTKYIKGMLKKFMLEYSKPVSTPMVIGCSLSKDDESLEVDHTMYRSMIGSLLYVTTTRQDVIQVVGLVARFQLAPKETHAIAVKIILRYLKGTIEYGLWCLGGQDFTLKEFIDADWYRSLDDQNSTSGKTFYFGDCLVSWLRKKQSSIALSIAEAEYIFATS